MNHDEMLNKSFESCGFSPTFCLQAAKMGYNALRDVIEKSPMEIIANRDFTYTWLGELSEFLEKHKLLHLLQPTPGKNYG
jgi:hypothetical protein